jgi:hypothetical protein
MKNEERLSMIELMPVNFNLHETERGRENVWEGNEKRERLYL